MLSLHALDDVERQAMQESPKETLSVLDSKELITAPFFGIGSDLPSRKHESLSDRTAQCCFLCLQGKKFGQYAVRVHCFRPTKSRGIACRQQVTHSGVVQPEKVTYKKLDPKENACESDATIYRRLNDTCFRYRGKWKKWIPFYGIVDVREVKFQILGVPDRAGRIPIHIYPINVDKIREKTEQTIALEPDYNFDDQCDQYSHSEACKTMMDTWNMPCIDHRIKEARIQRKKLDTLYLLRDCARSPWNANGLRTLEGMAQESCILDTKQVVFAGSEQSYYTTDELRGIEFVIGWQTDRIACEIPVRIAQIWFSLTIISVCVIVWGGSAGDWATAMAFGQLLVAFISLISFCAKD